MLPLLLLLNALFMTVIAATTFVFQSYKWWRPENCDPDRYGAPGRPRGKGLILLAARFEENVIGPTLERLAHLDYPDYTVAVIIDHPDDPATLAVARDFERRFPRRIVLIRYPEDTDVHNKPIGLNRALHDLEAMGIWSGTGSGVLDAEDLLHPGCCAWSTTGSAVTGAGIVQAGVQLMNFSSDPRRVRCRPAASRAALPPPAGPPARAGHASGHSRAPAAWSAAG